MMSSKALSVMPTRRAENMDIAKDAHHQDLATAKALHATGYYTDRFKTPEQMFMAVQMCRDLGIAPSLGMGMLYCVPGRSSVLMEGKAMGAVILSSAVCARLEYSPVDPETASVHMVRADGKMDHTETVTMVYAKAARWTLDKEGKTKPMWAGDPGLMLRYRALARCARFVFPDLLGGMLAVEEFGVSDPRELTTADFDNLQNVTLTVEDAPEPPTPTMPTECLATDLPCGKVAEVFIEGHPAAEGIGTEGTERIRVAGRAAVADRLSQQAVRNETARAVKAWGPPEAWTPEQEAQFMAELGRLVTDAAMFSDAPSPEEPAEPAADSA